MKKIIKNSLLLNIRTKLKNFNNFMNSMNTPNTIVVPNGNSFNIECNYLDISGIEIFYIYFTLEN